MSERGSNEGNTDAPRVDTEQYGQRDTGGSTSGGSAPRRVGDARRDSEASRGSGSSGAAYSSSSRDTDRGTSWVSVILGWLAALGAALILTGIVGAIVGAILGAVGLNQQGATTGGTSGLVGLLVTLFLAFLIGGYAAGRMASRSGVKHGLLVPLLNLIILLLLAIIGLILGTSFIDQLSGITLPGPIQSAAQSATQAVQQPQNLGTILTVSGILALLVPFIGGAIGGAWGARTGSDRP